MSRVQFGMSVRKEILPWGSHSIFLTEHAQTQFVVSFNYVYGVHQSSPEPVLSQGARQLPSCSQLYY